MLLFEMQDWFEKKGGLCVKMRLIPWDFLSSFSPSCSPNLADGLEEDPGVRQQWMREQITSSSCL